MSCTKCENSKRQYPLGISKLGYIPPRVEDLKLFKLDMITGGESPSKVSGLVEPVVRHQESTNH